MPLYIAKSGDLDRCYRCLTDWLTDSQMKDRATQLLIKYKSGALVTQFNLPSSKNTVVNLLPFCQLSDIAWPKKLLSLLPLSVQPSLCGTYSPSAGLVTKVHKTIQASASTSPPFQKCNAQIDGVLLKKRCFPNPNQVSSRWISEWQPVQRLTSNRICPF